MYEEVYFCQDLINEATGESEEKRIKFRIVGTDSAVRSKTTELMDNFSLGAAERVDLLIKFKDLVFDGTEAYVSLKAIDEKHVHSTIVPLIIKRGATDPRNNSDVPAMTFKVPFADYT